MMISRTTSRTEPELPIDTPVQKIHVISEYSGGEIRGFFLDEEGQLFLTLPNHAGGWPGLDAAVQAALAQEAS